MLVYILICIIWGCFSVYMQKKIYPNKSRTGDLVLNFIVNTLLAPISIVLAIYRYITKTGWAKDL